MSLILKSKQGLSEKTAKKISLKLGLSKSEQDQFLDLVAIEHSKNDTIKNEAKERIEARNKMKASVSMSEFDTMSDWHYMAILQLMNLKTFRNDPAWISKELGIPEYVVQKDIERLKSLKLVAEENGTLVKVDRFFMSPSEIPSDSIKKFHSQILDKAADALIMQNIEERDFSTLIFAISEDDMAWAKTQLSDFRRNFMNRLSSNPNCDRLYAFSLQLFALQERPT